MGEYIDIEKDFIKSSSWYFGVICGVLNGLNIPIISMLKQNEQHFNNINEQVFEAQYDEYILKMFQHLIHKKKNIKIDLRRMNVFYKEFSCLFISSIDSKLLLIDNILTIFKNCKKIIYQVTHHYPLSSSFFSGLLLFLFNVSNNNNIESRKLKKIEILGAKLTDDIILSIEQKLKNY